MVILLILLTIYSYTSDFQAQGRHVLPMVIPFMYLVTRGFELLMKWFVSNEKVQEWIVRILCGAYILFCLPGLFPSSFCQPIDKERKIKI